MSILELLLGQIPEALYFALFMILIKELKSKRIIFIILMILEYILLLNVFPYSAWLHILYFILSFIIMKILYKDECNVTDIFTLGISSIILGFISILFYFMTLGNAILSTIISKILLFILLYVFRYKLCNIKYLYYKLWNRSKHKYKIKSITFRAINLVVFNISFYIINLFMIFRLIVNEWR